MGIKNLAQPGNLILAQFKPGCHLCQETLFIKWLLALSGERKSRCNRKGEAADRQTENAQKSIRLTHVLCSGTTGCERDRLANTIT